MSDLFGNHIVGFPTTLKCLGRLSLRLYETHHEEMGLLPIRKTKAQISFAVTLPHKSEIQASIHLLVTAGGGLCQTWSGIPRTGFLATQIVPLALKSETTF